MAEPTLKDVLHAIAQLRAEAATKEEVERVRKEVRADVAEVRAEVAEVRAEVAEVRAEVAEVRAEVAEVRAEVAEVRAEVAEVRADVAEVRADVAAHRKETAKGFADLDAELAKHADPTHRKLEARIERLEKRTAPKSVSTRPLRRR